jgi:peptidoglycan hydrolase CwlO-like protein
VRRRSLVVTCAALAATIALAAPQLASSAPREDPRAQRERVRAERAKVAAKIDTSKATLREIDSALRALDENLRTQQAALARTEAEVAQAEQDIADAEAAIFRLTADVTDLRTEMRQRAVAAYVNPAGDDVLSVLESNDFTAASNRKFYIELRSLDDADLADRLEGARSDLAHQRKKATAARKRAEAKRAEQAERTDKVAAARGAQAKLSDNLSANIESDVARSIELAKTDRALSAKIAQELAARIARIAAAQAAADAAAAQAAAAKPQLPPSTQSPNGGESDPLPPLGSSGGGTGTGGISLCNAGGITVNCQIKDQTLSMLNAARADGVALSGGGYRDPAQQIALRRAHCGSSYYAIYQMPSSSCHPPTAKPGTSQHEVGLAIDFSNCSRGSRCFGWLSSNASSFGFYNLPSESWHWSTSGR